VDPQTDLPSSPERPSSGSPSAPDAVTAAASDEAAAGVPAGGGGLFADTVAELRKVVWPSRQQLFGESVAVILMVTLSAFAIAAVDRFYSWGNSQVFR
jgi:preprotein translocase subunit SecE